jgi:hypothetical protein
MREDRLAARADKTRYAVNVWAADNSERNGLVSGFQVRGHAGARHDGVNVDIGVTVHPVANAAVKFVVGNLT